MTIVSKVVRYAAAGALCLGMAAAVSQPAQAQDEKYKVFLSMSYIGNDWQAEAANMVKAMAAHKSMADKVDLQVQVAGPNAQRQIQQINAMVQAGADAIVVYPISPTALNSPTSPGTTSRNGRPWGSAPSAHASDHASSASSRSPCSRSPDDASSATAPPSSSRCCSPSPPGTSSGLRPPASTPSSSSSTTSP